jgi:hypothetical protein
MVFPEHFFYTALCTFHEARNAANTRANFVKPAHDHLLLEIVKGAKFVCLFNGLRGSYLAPRGELQYFAALRALK